MKASDAEEEIEQAKKAISVLGGTIKNVETFDLPQSDIGRTIITIEKIKNSSIEELTQVKGINEKLAQKLKKM